MSTGPFETEREAISALPAGVRADYSTASNFALLQDAITAAGVGMGTYDWLIVNWLAGWERATCAVVAGLISRAHHPELEQARATLGPGQLTTVLDALDVAADCKRDRAADCPDCEAHPAGLCDTCEWRLAVAGEYDELAETLRRVQ